MSDWMADVCGVTEEPAADVAQGWDFLGHVLQAGAGEGAAAAAVAIVSAGLAERQIVAGLGACHRLERARFDGRLLAVGAIRGLAASTKAIARAASEEAERQIEATREGRAHKAAQPSATSLHAGLSDSLNGYELAADLVAPPGYDVRAGGVWRRAVNKYSGEEMLVAVLSRPLVVVGRCTNVIDQTVTTLLAWRSVTGQWGQHTVPRGTAADSRSLVSLSNMDAPVHSNNAAECVAYIAAFEDANAAVLPEAKVSSVMGWSGAEANLSFLWGRHQVRGDGISSSGAVEETAPSSWRVGQIHLLPSDPGLRAAAQGFRAEGSFEGWVDAVCEATAYPRVMLAIFAAMVPPLMRFLPALSNFILDFSGVTSQGKTTALRAAASVWGCPDERGDGIIYSWDVTHVFVERITALCDYLPVLLDDTKRARRREDVGRYVYNHASGVGRGRGSLQSVQRTTRTHSVLLSTGEEAITSFTNDGGTRARCICLWGSPLGGTDEVTVDVVRKLNAGVMAHFGHLGPMLVQSLAADVSKCESLRHAYESELGRWTTLARGNAVASRAAQYVAALAVAEELFYSITSLPRPLACAANEAWSAVVDGSAEADRATEALSQVLSWATSQQGRFHGRLESEGPETGSAPHAGWLGAWAKGEHWHYLAVLPTELRAFLERQKFDAVATVRTWGDRGWLLRDGAHFTRKVTIGERKDRCHAISREACDFASGGDDA